MPNTESADMARTLVDFAKYAPLGHRGVSLSRPHTDFGKVDGPTYIKDANENTVLLCQIESRAGVESIEEIMAVDGIDVGFIGPNDMTQDYGILGQFDHPNIVAAFERIIAAARANHKFAGIHLSNENLLKRWESAGMSMNMWNSDSGFLMEGAAKLARLR